MNYRNPNLDNYKGLIKWAVIIIIAAILIFNSFYTINEQEAAVVTTFGIASASTESGLHFKIPFVQQVTKVDTTIKGFPIGYDAHTNNSIEDESLMITSDFNFVNVDFYVEYRVTDPVKALYASENYEAVLKTIAQSSIRAEIGSYPVDSVITTGKSEIQANIKDKISRHLEQHDIGITLINITIQDAEPPTAEVLEAFMNVESAKQGAETAVNNANKYRNEQIPAAEAEVDKVLKEAESTKEARINEAQGQASRFNEIYNEYKKYPLITKQRMFYEAMEELLPDLKVIIDGSEGGTEKILPIEPIISTGTAE
ncbi:MAG: FtsH protease activity modulator HflK [Lachnospiraceae bacterium]|jgi:membrane protease subunit HflK|nr:FtsH protease activity modulator HflK [Lachnospiraceae bacterium]MBR3581075.1 FtsH protease activity modulator HflK [Lachnospiraceae bacterium]MBR4541860.1 FtsH protease activity modulator HflK [Lachnospiraceae bacterium]